MTANKELVRDIKAAALARMEDAARTVEDFKEVQKQWNHLDENRERKERRYEVRRNENTLMLGYIGGQVFPVPISHQSWREAMRGDFHFLIYDNPEDMWLLVEDDEISRFLKALSPKQKNVLFLTATRSSTPQQIACYYDITDRAVLKRLDTTLTKLRDKLAPIIREQIENDSPDMTYAKRCFLERYEQEHNKFDSSKRKRYTVNITKKFADCISKIRGGV